MGKVRLNEYLEKEKELHSGIAVSSSIINKLEVYGFLNCKGREEILSGCDNQDINSYGDVEMNYDTSKCKIFSFYLKQNSKVTPIYPTISICQENASIDVKGLYIPSFIGTRTKSQKILDDELYSDIKHRFGTGYQVSENAWEKARWPSKYSLVAGDVMLHIKKGEIVLQDKDGCIKSVEDSIVVLCRYVHEETGEIRFLFSRLEQLYYEIKGTKKSNDR